MNLLRSLLEAAVTMVVLLGLARWALGLFGKKVTVYRATPARQLALLTWPLLAVGTGLATAAPGLVATTSVEHWLAWGLLLGLARWALGLFGKKVTVYRATPARQLALLTWPLLAVGTGLATAAPGLVATTSAEHWLAWGLLLAILALAAPALLLHLRYYSLNAATTLVFAPLEGNLQVALDEILAYDPARQGWPGPEAVEWSRCRWPGVFWRRYEYLRLPLPQGDIILTSLVISDMHTLVRYLRHFGVVVVERRRGWAWI